jgi:hypothetical protein
MAFLGQEGAKLKDDLHLRMPPASFRSHLLSNGLAAVAFGFDRRQPWRYPVWFDFLGLFLGSIDEPAPGHVVGFTNCFQCQATDSIWAHSNRQPDMVTAEQMLRSALNILQRGLPPGDLNQREALAELWGVFDNQAAIEVIKGARGLHSPQRFRASRTERQIAV